MRGPAGAAVGGRRGGGGCRELLAEVAIREARAAADREREAHPRVQQERLRLAREFHDAVAHPMAAVNVQTGVPVAAFDQRPDAARGVGSGTGIQPGRPA